MATAMMPPPPPPEAEWGPSGARVEPEEAPPLPPDPPPPDPNQVDANVNSYVSPAAYASFPAPYAYGPGYSQPTIQVPSTYPAWGGSYAQQYSPQASAYSAGNQRAWAPAPAGTHYYQQNARYAPAPSYYSSYAQPPPQAPHCAPPAQPYAPEFAAQQPSVVAAQPAQIQAPSTQPAPAGISFQLGTPQPLPVPTIARFNSYLSDVPEASAQANDSARSRRQFSDTPPVLPWPPRGHDTQVPATRPPTASEGASTASAASTLQSGEAP
jgi:hypothetical protein